MRKKHTKTKKELREYRDFTELLFEGRNREYGAYDLRRRYNKHLRMGLYSLIPLVILLLIPTISDYIFKDRARGFQEIAVELSPGDYGGLENHFIPPPPPQEETPSEVDEKAVPKVDSLPEAPKKKTKAKEVTKGGDPGSQTDRGGKGNADRGGQGDGSNSNPAGQGGQGGLTLEYDTEPTVLNYAEVMSKRVYPKYYLVRQIEDRNLTVLARVSSTGKVVSKEIFSSKGIKEFDEEALRLVDLMQIKPATRKGHTIDFMYKINIPFIISR